MSKYLSEAINSVVKQTLGKENIQIILVNDGSNDDSEKIAVQWQKKYPKNIVYIYQKNQGVSAARNNGLQYAKAPYINFLDGDDKWSPTAFKTALSYFEKDPGLAVVSCKMCFFDAQKGDHPLNFKFGKNQVTDIYNDYDYSQLHVTSSFIRKEMIGNIKFDQTLRYSEDAKFLGEVLLNSGGKIAFINTPFFYRKRKDNSSALDTMPSQPDYYIDVPQKVYEYHMNESVKKHGIVIPYFQTTFMYDNQWRIGRDIPLDIYSNYGEKMQQLFESCLSKCEDFTISQLKNTDPIQKIKLLNVKNNENIVPKLEFRKHGLYFNNLRIVDLKASNQIRIESMNFINGNMEIHGLIRSGIPEPDLKWYAVINGQKRILLELHETALNPKKYFNKVYYHDRGFDLLIPIKDFSTLHFENEYKGYGITKSGFIFCTNGKLDPTVPLYYIYGKKLFTVKEEQIIAVKSSLKNRFLYAIRLASYLCRTRKRKYLLYRMVPIILKKLKRKELWIFIERPSAANDNAFALFQHVCKNEKPRNVKCIFAISKTSRDWKKVSKVGKTIPLLSKLYKVYFMMADKIISSQAEYWVYNPFAGNNRYFRDLYTAKFIFLQHGIIKDDLSTWLNHYEKNFSLFVTAAVPEYESIVSNSAYGYGKECVRLLGLPRYDLLVNAPEPLIAILPTWRESLAAKIDPCTGKHLYQPHFKESNYWKFFNNLINDERLLSVMREKGVKGIFAVHPCFEENYIDFSGNDIFVVNKGLADYNAIFKKASLVVSDYSSAPFDFSYMEKPVIYSQFDKDTFFQQHTYTKGYFEYERDGFGPVVYNYDDTINEIIRYIQNGFVLEEKYKTRINSFFAYHDRENCSRVYNAILDLSQE